VVVTDSVAPPLVLRSGIAESHWRQQLDGAARRAALSPTGARIFSASSHISSLFQITAAQACSMTRALLALLLVLGQFPVGAETRRRAVRHPAAPVAPAALVTAAREAAAAAMATGVPAVQIAVSHRGSVIYSEAFGVTDKQSATAATPRSVMQIGSITKQFTAAAILRLAERGALTLDDPIDKFVPEFNARGRTITLRHLLSHRSGVPRDWSATGLPFSPVTRAQVVAGINAKPFDFAPNSQWKYSNAGFMLLGYAIESITGKSYSDFIHSEFVLPLGLLDTGVCGTFNLPRPEGYGVFPQTVVRLPAVHPSGLISSGSLCSTASDLARWAHLLASGRVMLPASYATMTTVPPAPLASYGLGVDLKNMLGHPAVSHGGAIDGYLSFLLYFPHRDIAVAVITNAFPAPTNTPPTIALTVGQAALDSL
jgi:CubicO group peptidase (beta-lactamase class C family)